MNNNTNNRLAEQKQRDAMLNQAGNFPRGGCLIFHKET